MQSISDIVKEKLVIALAADHGGFEAKKELMSFLPARDTR